MANSFSIQLASSVRQVNGIWSGGPNGTWTKRGNGDLVNGINITTINVNTLLGVGKLTGSDPSAIGTWLCRFELSLVNNVISLNGGPLTNYFALPPGFTPISASMNIGSRGSVTSGGGLVLQFDVFRNSASLAFVGSNLANAYSFAYNFSQFPNPTMLDIISNGFALQPTFIGASDFAAFYNFSISGNYTIVPQQFTIQNQQTPVSTGSKVSIVGTGLNGVTQIQLNWTDPVTGPQQIIIPQFSNYIIQQLPFELIFYVPPGFNTFNGIVTVTLVGNGIQFSGSVLAGILQILFADGSGIYQLSDTATSDALYFRNGFSTNVSQVMVPSILEDTEIIPAVLSQENATYESDLSYPTAVISESEEDEEYFSFVSTPYLATSIQQTEIPSPFIKTAFLP